jgi:hypothetical protein
MASGRLRGLAALLGVIAFAAAVAWFGIAKSPAPRETSSANAVPPAGDQAPAQASPEQTANISQHGPGAVAPQAVDAARDQPRPTEQAAPAQDKTPAGGETPKPSGPSFDVVRVEPSGDSVIAGRGAPGATIEMLRNGRSHARVLADTSGLFAFVPPPLGPGSHEITLSSVAPDGTRAQARESVTVVINEDRTTKPLVTLASPDRPTVVLSAPDPSSKTAAPQTPEPPVSSVPVAAAPAASQPPAGVNPPPPAPRPGIKIASVEAEEGGRLFVSGQAAPGATVRLYLNESFIAPGGTGNDGKVAFAIGRGVQPGTYRVRIDDVDPVSGHVKSRAEVAFKFPAPLTVPLPPHVQPQLPGPDLPATATAGVPVLSAGRTASTTQQPGREAAPEGAGTAKVAGPSAGAGLAARGMDPGTVVVPEINTAMVARGDNLWRISRRIYGQGTRYTVIYDANQGQIRNPDRIYPGQLFVLPPGTTSETH